MKPLLSVVVPIYNVERYIEKCLHSIMNQTYENVQIVLIDDGSIDLSGEICDRFAMIDSRIEVIHQANYGSTAARKRGIEASKGEYIIWVDSDDWIEPDYFEKMVKAAVKNKADLIVADLYFDIGEDSTVITNKLPCGIYSTQNILEKILYYGSFFEYGIQPHGVTKLFKADLLRDVHKGLDLRIGIGDDAAVVYSYIFRSRNIVVTDICCYHYVQHADSLTKRKKKNEVQGIEILISYLKNIFKNHDILMQHLAIYQNYLLVLRDLSYWDNKMLLYPYGGIEPQERIVIYGAGGMGQSLHSYCRGHNIMVVSWVDRNYTYYQSDGLPVISFDEFQDRNEEWDYIFIANTNEQIAMGIKKQLTTEGIEEKKIRWFSPQFLNGE
ncbi:MAG: glycosyltransferase [Lachnospiraceae bacterium]|nr:glycosyltransferase [Lachnospiraceae bacterium]